MNLATRLMALALSMALFACATVSSYRQIDQPIGAQLTTSIGGTIFRLNRSSDLPNAFGRADLYGGKVDRGYAELKFLGINDKGEVLLSVIDVNRSSAETTMDRYAARPVIQVQTNVEVGAVSSDAATTFSIDLKKQQEIVIAGVRVVFTGAQPVSVSYRLEDTQ